MWSNGGASAQKQFGPLQAQSSAVPFPAVPPSGWWAQNGGTVVAVSKLTHNRPARQSLLNAHGMRQRAPVIVPGYFETHLKLAEVRSFTVSGQESASGVVAQVGW